MAGWVFATAVAAVAPGSWSSPVPAVRVGGPARMYASGVVAPPRPLPPAARLQRVRWRYHLPAGARLDAWLCTGDRCVVLAGRSGVTAALAGSEANAPLRLRFRLPAGARRPVKVTRIQLTAEYR